MREKNNGSDYFRFFFCAVSKRKQLHGRLAVALTRFGMQIHRNEPASASTEFLYRNRIVASLNDLIFFKKKSSIEQIDS